MYLTKKTGSKFWDLKANILNTKFAPIIYNLCNTSAKRFYRLTKGDQVHSIHVMDCNPVDPCKF